MAKKNLPAGYKSVAEYEESAEWDGRLLRAKFMKVYGLTERSQGSVPL